VSTSLDSCITQLKAQGPSRTCDESKEEEKQLPSGGERCLPRPAHGPLYCSRLVCSCVCVCAFVCERERARERENECKRKPRCARARTSLPLAFGAPTPPALERPRHTYASRGLVLSRFQANVCETFYVAPFSLGSGAQGCGGVAQQSTPPFYTINRGRARTQPRNHHGGDGNPTPCGYLGSKGRKLRDARGL